MTDPITNELLAGIVTISADAVVCVDEAQKIIFFNDGAEKIFGYTAAEILGQPLEALLPERFRKAHATQVHRFGRSETRARKMGERGQISGLRKNGQEFPAEAAISHVGEEGNQVYSVVLRDVTERRKAHEAQTFLAEAGETLALSLGAEDTLRTVAQLAVPRLADACIVHSYHNDVFKGVGVAHVDPEKMATIERQRVEHPIDYTGNHPVARAIRSRTPVVLTGSDPETLESLSRSSDFFDKS